MCTDFPVVLYEAGKLVPAKMSRGIRELAAGRRWRTGAVDAVHQACLQVGCVRGKCKDAGEFDEGLRSEVIVAVFLHVPHLKTKTQSVPADNVSESIGRSEEHTSELQ